MSRILTTRVPTKKPVFKFYRCEHDNFTQEEIRGVVKNIRADRSNVTETGLSGLHPYLIDSWSACQQNAPHIVNDIDNNMMDDRPDSQFMVVAATNIRFYCFLVDLPVGHFNYRVPQNILKRTYIEDVYPPKQDNLCLFRCIVKGMRPLESLADREKRVKLMWRIFKASQIQPVSSDSIIKNHRQVYLEDDLDYLYQDILDYKDLMRELPPDHKWGGEQIQSALNTMTGVTLKELDQVESFFNLHIDVFTLTDNNEKQTKKRNQETVATSVRLSDKPTEHTVSLLIVEEEEEMPHYMLINDTKQLFKKLVCPHCSAILKERRTLKNHIEKCKEGRVRHVYPGGFHKQPLTIRDKLESVGVRLPEHLAYYASFICFDFESLMKNLQGVNTDKTEFISQHCPVSYALCDSLGETLSRCHEDPKQLMLWFVRDLLTLRKKLVHNLTEDFRPVFDDLNELLAESYSEVQHLKENDPCQGIDKEQEPVEHRLAALNIKWAQEWYQNLVQIKKDVTKYIKMVPVLGYNSAHYDINLIKQHLITLLMEDNRGDRQPAFITENNMVEDHYPQDDNFEVCEGLQYPEYEAEPRDFGEINVIKQGGSYSQLVVGQKFKFLDVYKFQSPNTSLDQFMKTYKAPVSKGVFPYEYLTSETLHSRDLPTIEDFYSQLKGKNLLGDTKYERHRNYLEKVIKVWHEQKCETLKDFLLYYNHLDVQPFALAVIQWLKNFHLYNEDGRANTKEGVDVLKTSIGIPGVARQLMYNSASAQPGFKGFMLFDEQNRDWDDRFRNNIVGGPSVIYSFHHKAGQTRLRDPVKGKLCRSVLGLDATALYASRIRKPLPHGPAIRYDPCDPPEGSTVDPGERWFQRKMACQMDSRVSMKFLVEQGNPNYGPYPDLKHLYNQGRETKFGPFAVDGVSYEQRTILEYNGCWYHGCPDCWAKKARTMPEQDREQEFRYRRTQARAKWLEEKTGCRVKQVWGCDPEAMRYVWGAHKLGSPFTSQGRKLNEKVDQTKLLNGVCRGTFTGALEVDIQVPETHYKYFEEFSPLFITAEIKVEDLSPEQRDSLPDKVKSKVQLVPGMRAEKVLIDATLLKWYMEHSLVVSKVHCAVEFEYSPIFRDFIDTRTQKRREASLAGNVSEAALHKLIGNSAYGCTLLNKEKYVKIAYADVKRLVTHHHKKGSFLRSRLLTPQLAEVDHEYAKVRHDIPIQLGYSILQGGKQRMLEFYYDCLDYYADRDDWQLVEVDTDSQYLALSEPIDKAKMDANDLGYHPLMSIVRPEKMPEFKAMLYNRCHDDWEPRDSVHFFPRQCCRRHNKLDQKRPGLFKTEVWGTEITCACSKTYSVITCDPDPTHPSGFKEKISSKGVQGRALQKILNECNTSFGQLILEAQQGRPTRVTNVGFRTSDKQGIRTYRQQKNAINTRYMKLRKYGNNTAPILSVLTPYRSSQTTARLPIRKTTEPVTGRKRRGAQPGSDSPSHKRSRRYNSSQSSDSDQEVRRELGLNTNKLITNSSESEGEDILFLDDGYQVG